jgi:uncharacterized membrane protein YqjE
MGIKSKISEYFNFGELKDNMVRLVEAKFELKKIEIQEKLEGLAAQFLIKLFTFLVLFAIIIFASILIAVLLNQWIGSSWAGYAIMLGIYILVFAILSIKEDKVEEVIVNVIRKEIEKREL